MLTAKTGLVEASNKPWRRHVSRQALAAALATGSAMAALGAAGDAQAQSGEVVCQIVVTGGTAGTPTATGVGSFACGQNATVNGAGGTAIGANAQAQAEGTAVGVNSGAVSGGTAIGAGATATDGGVAVGLGAFATDGDAVALGMLAFAENGNVAIGGGATVTSGLTGSVAIGDASLAAENNVVSFGNATIKRRLVNLSDGLLSTTSSDATTGAQMFSTRNSIATFLGGGASVSASGVFTGPTFSILGANQTTVGGALGALNTRVIQNSADITALATTASGCTVDINARRAACAEGSASGDFSTAVGVGALSDPTGTAIGANASGFGEGAVAIGALSFTDNSGSTAVGTFAQATGDRSTALGIDSRARGQNSVALGSSSFTDQANTVSIGNDTLKRRLLNLADGTLSSTSSDAVTGAQLFSTRNSLASFLGGGASVDASGLITGPTFSILGTNQTTVGGALGALNTRVLQNTTDIAALAGGGVVLPITGNNQPVTPLPLPTATGSGTIAVGWGAQVTGGFGSALGHQSVAASDATALGYNARATGDFSLAGGASSEASGFVAIALGNGALASSFGGLAVGGSARATGENAVALGSGAIASATNAVAIGLGSQANEANTISVGAAGAERRIVNVAAGTLAAGSTHAATAGQLFATNEMVALNTAGIAALGNRVTTAETSLTSLDSRVTANTTTIANLQGQIGAGGPGLVVQDPTTLAVSVAAATGGTEVSVEGSAGRRRLRGLADGDVSATSADAVTCSQLFATGQIQATQGAGLASALGGGATYNAATGAIGAPNYVVLGSSHGNVGAALTTLSTRVQSNTTDIGALQAAGSVGGGGTQAAEIAALQAQLTALQNTLAAQQALIAPLQTELARLTGGNLGGGTATGPGTTAGGDGSVANQPGATAFGQGARAIGDPTTAIGFQALASGQHGTAIGGNAEATGDLSTALGQAAVASGAGSTALGQGAVASQANTIAIGQGVQTTRANQVAIGGSTNTYTLAGIHSQASRDAQAGATYVVTADSNGNLATMDMNPFFGRLDSVENRLDGIDDRWRVNDEVEERQNDGIAMALALSGAQVLQPGQTFAVSANVGHFDGASAVGFGATGRIADRVWVNVGIGSGFETGGVAGRAGISFGW